MAFVIAYELNESLYINLTNHCTNNCDFCVRNNTDGISKELDLWLDREPSVQEIIGDIKKFDLNNYKELVFCGYGEPLIRASDVFEVCKYVRSNSKIIIRINTNGQANLFHKNDITPNMKGLIDIVSISLNASNAFDYDKSCKSTYGEDAFFGMIEFAKLCKKYVPSVVFTVVDVIGEIQINACRNIADEIGVEFRVRRLI